MTNCQRWMELEDRPDGLGVEVEVEAEVPGTGPPLEGPGTGLDVRSSSVERRRKMAFNRVHFLRCVKRLPGKLRLRVCTY